MARGWFGLHPRRSVEDRLWDKVDGPWVDGVEWDDCWFFTGSWRSKYGYGRVKAEGSFRTHMRDKKRGVIMTSSFGLQAHVVAFEQFFGPLAPGDYARHACDKPLCCNPFHIAPGTHQDNEQDKVDKEFAWACTALGAAPRSYQGAT